MRIIKRERTEKGWERKRKREMNERDREDMIKNGKEWLREKVKYKQLKEMMIMREIQREDTLMLK